MKTFQIAAIAAAAQLSLLASAYAYNISEDWRWKASSLGTATVRGEAIRVGWSIPRDGTLVAGGGVSNLNTTLQTKFGANYFDIFRFMFGRVGAVSGLEFVETPDDGASTDAPALAGVRGDVRIVGRDLGGPFGWSNMPSPNGVCVIQMNTVVGMGWSWGDWVNVTMHEIGHSAGLAHQRVYVSSTATDPDLNGTLMGICNTDGPQFDDVWALNRLYGDKLERNGGNDTRAKATDLGAFNLNSKALGTDAGPLRMGSTASDFVSIDGTSDTDFFKFHTDSWRAITVGVTPKGPTYDFVPGDGGGTRQTFEASRQSDLWFDLLDSTGALLAHVDLAGPGALENLRRELPAGDYFIRIAGKQDSAQMYRLDLSAEVPEPAALTLLALAATTLLLRRPA